ncbi:MAG: Lrp/AsnC family transcriptional regulator [Caulobacter sp.]|nr:Lrp/AsnC family transcriptional regulator [Caulobacter sp.]
MSIDIELDELSLGIIRALQLEPRTSNKDIAERLSASEATVASRIRSLEERNVLRVMMQRDFEAMGYDLMALIDIHLSNRAAEDVAQELSAIEEAAAVSVMMSNPDIIVHLSIRDRLHLQDVIEQKIAAIPGIASYEVTLALEVVKLDAFYGALDAPA